MDSASSHQLWIIKEKNTGEMMYGIPHNWIIHTKPSGYTDRDLRLKITAKFTHVCGESKNKNNSLL